LVKTLNSTGLNTFTTQDGFATAEKSALLALEIQLSTLHEPVSEMSAASTAYAPLAARPSSVASSAAKPGTAANSMRCHVNPIW